MIFTASCSVQSCGKNCNDLKNILDKVILKAGIFCFIDDDDFDSKVLAEGEDELCSETEQSVFMGQDKPVYLAGTNALDKLTKASFLVVEARTQVLDSFIDPPIC